MVSTSNLSTTARSLARHWVSESGPEAIHRARSRPTAVAVAAQLLEVGWEPAVVSAVLTAWWGARYA